MLKLSLKKSINFLKYYFIRNLGFKCAIYAISFF